MKKLIPFLLSLIFLMSPAIASAERAPREVNTYVETDEVEQLPQQNGNNVSRVVKKTFHEFSDGSVTIDVEAVYTLSAPESTSDQGVSPQSNPGSGSNGIVSLTCGFSVTSYNFTQDDEPMLCWKITSYNAKATLLNQNYEMTQLNYSAIQGAGYGFTSTSSTNFVYLAAQSSNQVMYAPASGTQYSKTSGFTNYYFLKSVIRSYATVYYKPPIGSTASFSVSATF